MFPYNIFSIHKIYILEHTWHSQRCEWNGAGCNNNNNNNNIILLLSFNMKNKQRNKYQRKY